MKGQSTLLVSGMQITERGGRHLLCWSMYHCTEGWEGERVGGGEREWEGGEREWDGGGERVGGGDRVGGGRERVGGGRERVGGGRERVGAP